MSVKIITHITTTETENDFHLTEAPTIPAAAANIFHYFHLSPITKHLRLHNRLERIIKHFRYYNATNTPPTEIIKILSAIDKHCGYKLEHFQPFDYVFGQKLNTLYHVMFDLASDLQL